MRVKRLAMVAGTATAMMALQAMSGAMAQAMLNERATISVTPVRAEGVQLRRVSATDSAHLAYEYQTGAGVSRVSVDPTSLMNDIERARKRASQKKGAGKAAPAPAPAIALPAADVRSSEIAQADIAAPAPDVAPVPREDRKVRVIPLYNEPKAD